MNFLVPFDYRFYKKKSKFICLRSLDGERHFTLIHVKDQIRKDFPNNEWDDVNEQIKNYLEKNDWKLKFTPQIACRNCTYGFFEKDFEELIYSIRKKYGEVISTDHDITYSDEDNVNGHTKSVNLFAHMSHSRGENQELCKFMQKADKKSTLVLDIKVRSKKSD